MFEVVESELPVNRMCELVEVPRSSFYAWLNHAPSAHAIADPRALPSSLARVEPATVPGS